MKRFIYEKSKFLIGLLFLCFLSNGWAYAFDVTISTSAAGGSTSFCQGTIITLTVSAPEASGDPALFTYNWGGDLTFITVIAPGVALVKTSSVAGDYYISCEVIDEDSNSATGDINLTLLQSPSALITANGEPTTFCDGGSVVLSANTGAGLTYQWRRGIIDIPGATNSDYTATVSGVYRVNVIGSNLCSKLSNTITVTVNPLPAATAGSNSPVCYDGTINLTSTPNGMVSYSWVTTALTPLTPANAALQNPSITNATPSNSGDYTVTVTDGNSCSKSATTSVLVYNDVNGGTIGLDHSICYNGDPNAFTDMASPSGGDASWSISWESFSGGGPWTPIIGADQLTYDAPAGLTQTTQYRRVATNGCETVNSNTITVTVYPIMDGGVIGSDQALCFGADPVAFSNTTPPSGGNGAWTYSWESKVGAGAWTPIIGADQLTYDAPAGITQTTSYQRVATNSCGTVYSNTVTVTITPALLNNTIAAPQAICSGDTPALLVGSTPSGGSGVYTYQWQSSTLGAGGPFNDIVGVVSRDYQPGALFASTWYQRVAYSGACTSTSVPIAITVNPVITNNTIPALQNVCPGVRPANIVGSTPSGGDGIYAYQWQISLTGIVGSFSNIAGATARDYRPPTLAADRWFQRVVSSGNCTSISNVIHIALYPDITNYSITANQTICEGDTPAQLDGGISGGGTGPCTYKWQVATVAAAGPFSDIAPLATGQNYTPPSLNANRWYRRITYSGTCNRISNVIAITVTPAITNNTISSSQPVCFNSAPSLLTGTIPTGGTGVYTFQWKSSTVGAGGPFTDIAGPSATLQDYQPGALTLNTWFVREVKSGLCSNISSALAITVNPLPTITLTVIPPISACSSAEKFFLPYSATTGTRYSISAGAAPLAGFAAINNAPIVPSPLEIPIPKNSAVGTYQFTITVSDANGCVSTSQNFDLTINSIPAVTFGGTLADQCADATTYLLTGGTPVGGSYTGPGVTTLTSNFDASVAGAGTHTITYTYSDGTCSNFATNTITVNPTISNNTISTTNPTICYNTSPVLTGLIPTGGDGITYTYKWQSSTTGAGGPFTDILDANATNKDYTSPMGITQDTWYKRLVSSGPCTNDESNVIKITVGAEFTVTITPTSPKCVGSADGEATANPVGGIPGYTYSWSPISKTDNPVTGLSAGIPYTVTVTDNIGCTATATVTLTDPTPITLGLPTVVDVTGCFGGNNGSIQIQAAGGLGPYKYDLYNNGAFVATQTLAGSVTFSLPTTPITASTQYEVRVTDANGCGPVSSGLIEVKQPDQLVITNVTTTPISCNGSADGVITINASGGTGPYTYSVTGPLPGGTFQLGNTFNVGKGSYEIVVMDANSCSATWPVEIILTDPPKISFNYLVTQITTCSTDNTGKIEILNATGGSGSGYEYSIYQPPVWGSNPVFDNLPGGTSNPYYVRVRDSKGCILTANNGSPIIIDAPDPITFDVVNQVNVTGCWYNENGSFRVQNASGGTGNLSVSINGTDWYSIPRNFTLLGVDDYSVRVRDDNNCIVTQIVSITGPTPITLDAPPLVVGLSCNGMLPADGEIHVAASGGAGGLTYSIDGGIPQADGNFTGLSAGDHIINITDILGCILPLTINVPEPPAIVFTTEEKTDITCFGVPADGTITLQASGGTGALTYTINANPLNPMNGATLTPGAGLPAIFSGLMADSYSYLVTDSKGCTQLSTVNLDIIEPALFTFVSATNTPLDCNGDNSTVTLVTSGGTLPISYTLTDGGAYNQTTNDGIFSTVPAGTYNYSITDANTCNTFTGTVVITQPDPIIIDPPIISQMTGPATNDGIISVTANGGTPPLQYDLNRNGSFVTSLTPGLGLPAIFNGLSAGTYVVDVIDSKGCTVSTSPLLIGLLDLTLTPTQITCNGLNNGQIVLTVNSGTPPYTITWTGPSGALPAFNDMMTIGPLAPGLYSVNVVDGIGVIGTASATITEPAAFDATLLSVNDKQCFGGAIGSVTFNISGGNLPYTIAWTEGSTPRTEVVNLEPFIATNVAPGTYTFTITDAGSCGSKTIPDITLADPAQLNITNIEWNRSCYGVPSGSIIVTATGGSAPLTYSIAGPVSLSNSDGIFNNLPPGGYTVSLMDINSCPAIFDVPFAGTLNENPEIIINSTTSPYLTCSYDLGSIDVTVTGGTPFGTPPNYTYSWSTIPEVTTEDLTAHKGTYTVTVTDAAGCSNDQPATIDGPDDLIAFADIDDAICSQLKVAFGQDIGRIEIVFVTGGTGIEANFQYTWGYPVSPPVSGRVIDKLSGGTYTVTIIDENSCTYKQSFTVNSNPDYVMDAYILKDTILCGSSSVELVAFHNGLSTTPPRTYTYSWYQLPNVSGASIGDQPTYTAYPTQKTQYSVQITNDGGCLSSDTVTVDIYPKIDISVPLYISALQQNTDFKKDTIIAILMGNTYNLDVVTANTTSPTTFIWKPEILFEPYDSWNSSIYIDKDIKAQIPANRIANLRENPSSNRTTEFILIDVYATATQTGCMDSLRLYAKMVDNISFGNVFSPNDDGINDVWEVPKDYLFPDLNIEIFNRWGARVWSASGDKAAKGWNGRTDNGKELPIGTYYYVVKFNVNNSDGGWKPINGSITIVR
ncbi:MAG: hypothetical protein EHM93_07980 [Bacteroidales bacterium]|nr:MAG: hypothetical protein EHM93_07980 [Bacteroidales bacterium]